MSSEKVKKAAPPTEEKLAVPQFELTEIGSAADDETGSIRISENVIAAVVRKYTMEVKGVARFASNTLVSGIAEMIGRRSSESNVVVDVDGDAVSISVTLVLHFGVRIPEVAALVQDVVRTRVEELTGKQVGKVNVVVQDLEEPGAEKKPHEPEVRAEQR